ncbi:MAG: rhodanese-like domain-containing protein [Chloroflexota bacterium]|nr:rhodanese-like domain-containing protein [Chloroflexota bacterium]
MYTDLNSEDFRQQFASGESGEYQFIDVREEEEHAEVHIPGAINIPLSEFAARLDEISEDAPVVLVCNTGVRSSQAALFLAGMGYDQDLIFNLEDGTKGWMKKGYKIEGEASEQGRAGRPRPFGLMN